MERTKPTILYVDDEKHNLEAFSAAFRQYYNVLTSLSGAEAVEILKKTEIDVIITDQRMPEMTGIQFLEAVIPDYPEPIRMILTGFTDVDSLIKAINNGSILRYITKPWDQDELKQVIDTAVKIHSLEQQNRTLIKKLQQKTEQQKQMIDLFQKYVPKDVVNEILNPENETTFFSKEYRVVSVLFSDICDFTPFSESLDPKETVAYLNKYFTIMTECVTKNKGSVYKFLGDGLMAIFGAPISSMHNQQNAVLCALDMMTALAAFNKEFQHQTNIRIGISTGGSVVGHIVSEHYLSYAVIGEVINDAITIADLARPMPNSILLSETTCNAVKNDVHVESIGEVDVDSKKENIFKVIGKN